MKKFTVTVIIFAFVALLVHSYSHSNTINRPSKTFGGTSFINGVVPDATDFNGDIDTIYSEFNGNIDNANIKSGAAIAGSKVLPNFTTDISDTSSLPCNIWDESDQAGDARRWYACVTGGAFQLTTRTDVGGVQNTWLDVVRATGKFKIGTAPTDGQIPIGSTSDGKYQPANITAGNGVTVTNGANTITISAAGGSRGYLWGLTLSNNTGDATNDIDISTGEAASDDALLANRVIMDAGAMTKQLDAAWAAGNNAGFRCSGAIANGTWHVFLFRRGGGADDYCADQSLSPTLPDSGTKKRRIGSILRESGAIVGFVQDGDYFRRKATILSVDTTNPGTSAVLATLHVPTGLNVRAFGNFQLFRDTASSGGVFSDPAANDEAPNTGAGAPLLNFFSNVSNSSTYDFYEIRTNTSAQIRYRIFASDVNTIMRIVTAGWYDGRGRTN